MNNYIEKFRRTLPLLKYRDAPGTQEDGYIRHLLILLDLKSNYLIESGQRSLDRETLGRIENERQAAYSGFGSFRASIHRTDPSCYPANEAARIERHSAVRVIH